MPDLLLNLCSASSKLYLYQFIFLERYLWVADSLFLVSIISTSCTLHPSNPDIWYLIFIYDFFPIGSFSLLEINMISPMNNYWTERCEMRADCFEYYLVLFSNCQRRDNVTSESHQLSQYHHHTQLQSHRVRFHHDNCNSILYQLSYSFVCHTVLSENYSL